MAQYSQIIDIFYSNYKYRKTYYSHSAGHAIGELQGENKRLKQALEMVLSQSRIEFDLTAQIIGYTRTKQILGEMFIEQRQHLSNQLQELSQLIF